MRTAGRGCAICWESSTTLMTSPRSRAGPGGMGKPRSSMAAVASSTATSGTARSTRHANGASTPSKRAPSTRPVCLVNTGERTDCDKCWAAFQDSKLVPGLCDQCWQALDPWLTRAWGIGSGRPAPPPAVYVKPVPPFAGGAAPGAAAPPPQQPQAPQQAPPRAPQAQAPPVVQKGGYLCKQPRTASGDQVLWGVVCVKAPPPECASGGCHATLQGCETHCRAPVGNAADARAAARPATAGPQGPGYTATVAALAGGLTAAAAAVAALLSLLRRRGAAAHVGQPAAKEPSSYGTV